MFLELEDWEARLWADNLSGLSRLQATDTAAEALALMANRIECEIASQSLPRPANQP